MSNNTIFLDKFKESRIYGINSSKTIKDILNIPLNVDLKNLDKYIDNYYDTFYIEKKCKTISKEDKIKNFLNIEKNEVKRLKTIPRGEENNYRKIVTINEKWLKKSQKKLNRILLDILLTKKIRGKKRNSIVPYLHSAVKHRCYHTNAKVHIGDKYVLAIDLKDFYPSVSKCKVYNFFKKNFNLSSDAAMIYAVLSTCKNDNGDYCLGQGLSQSTTLAYLVNYTLFDYLYEEAKKIDIEMTIYVDDVVFSSKKIIPQEFVDRLFGIIKGNDMSIKKSKVHNYKKESVKKITGVYINGNKTRVSNMKHYEFETQYKELKKEVYVIYGIDDYFKVYNLYLKFYGNYQHIKMVEGIVNKKYEKFINMYDKYFPKGILKKNSSINYNINNIKRVEDKNKIYLCFNKLKLK